MKSATLPRAEDKRIVRNALPSSNIFTAAVARLYVALPIDADSWRYSGLWGAVTFCKDRNKNNSYFIRVIDMENNRGVVWEQELYNGFEYVRDCAFFHTFETDDCLAGILFVHQGEADIFHDKVINRENIKLKDCNKSHKSHDIGRIGYIPGRGFTVENNDLEILEILRELEKLEDFSPADIDQNQEFIQDFIRQCKKQSASAASGSNTKCRRAPPPPPPPSRRTTKRNNNLPPAPPIPPIMNRSAPASAPPPPPPLPGRGTRQTSAPPPPPPPPPTPPIPAMGVSSPPPPPPPAMGSDAPAPPPPPPMSSPIPNSTLPPSSGGRNDLMTAIRSTGGFGSLKKGGSLRSISSNNSSSRSVSSMSTSSKSAAAPSMASSLAAVLQQRKTAMQSDEEEDEDDDDWK